MEFISHPLLLTFLYSIFPSQPGKTFHSKILTFALLITKNKGIFDYIKMKPGMLPELFPPKVGLTRRSLQE